MDTVFWANTEDKWEDAKVPELVDLIANTDGGDGVHGNGLDPCL